MRGPGSLSSNAAAMMAATLITSALGLVFWSVAARIYPAQDVGTGNGLVSAASLLAGLAQVSLGVLCVRYVPAAGSRAKGLIGKSLALACVLAVLLAVGYLTLGFGAGIVTGWQSTALFVFAVPLMAVFALQDVALLSLGAARWVAIENAAHSVAKLALLPVLVTQAAVSGIFLSWVATTAITVLAIVTAIFLRIAPRAPVAPGFSGLPPRSTLISELAVQGANTSLGYVLSYGVPLVVLWRLGPTQAAHLALPWLIGGTFLILNMNILSAMRVHATSGQPVSRNEVWRVLAMLSLVSGVVAAIGAVLAPWVITIAAPGYGPESAQVLRWMCWAAPLWAVWHLHSTYLWIDARMRPLIGRQVLLTALTLTLIWLLAPESGIESVGVAWFIAGLLAAAISVRSLGSRLRSDLRRRSGHVPVSHDPVDLNVA